MLPDTSGVLDFCHGAERQALDDESIQVSKRRRIAPKTDLAPSSDQISASQAGAQESPLYTLATAAEVKAEHGSAVPLSPDRPARLQPLASSSSVSRNTPESRYTFARMLRLDKRYSEAFQQLSELNTPEAKLDLALMHLNGEGIPKNPELAIDILKKINTAASNIELGIIYHEGNGVEKDIRKALEFYKASDLAEANVRAGNIYYHGTGADQNYALAMYHYERASHSYQLKRDYSNNRRIQAAISVTKSEILKGRKQEIKHRAQERAALRAQAEDGITAKEQRRLQYVDEVMSKLEHGISPATNMSSYLAAKAIYDNIDVDRRAMMEVYIEARHADTPEKIETALARIPDYRPTLGVPEMKRLHWDEDQQFGLQLHEEGLTSKNKILEKLNAMPPASVGREAPWLNENIDDIIRHIEIARLSMTEDQEKAANELIEAFLNMDPMTMSAAARRLGQLLHSRYSYSTPSIAIS